VNPQIRLLIDAHGFDTHFQGSRTYIAGLYRSLIAQAPWIHFFFAASDITALQAEFGLHENVSFVNFKVKNNLFRLAFDIPRIIKEHRIDIAHFQYAVPFLKTSKEIVTIHDVLFLDYPEYFPFFYRFIRAPIFKNSAHRADLLLTVSDYAKKSIARHFKLQENKIRVLPNGIDQSFLLGRAPVIETSSPYILYVSRWEPRKNHLLLTRAFMELGLHHQGYKLVFIGRKDIPSKDFNNYWDTLSSEEQKSVVFLDSVSQEELAAYYHKSSLFVYPSLAEGFGIPPIEAAAMDVPVLCSNTTAMSDFTFFKEGLFNPQNKEELKAKIRDALAYRDETRIQNIRSYVVNVYDWNVIAGKYLQMIREKFLVS
jgi:glycosyltransferase involved in cell wall biosynthesis